MKAVILSVGAELLQGFLTDTNSTYLAQELNALGIEVVGVNQVGDDLDRLTLILQRAIIDADLIISTGGIGPTVDDLTREAVARVVGETPEVDPATLETVRAFFHRRGSEMPERNAKQAWIIPSAEIMTNPVGTAPGWFVRHNDTMIAIMPGVPREMMPMWTNEVIPRIRPRLSGDVIVSQTLKTIGIGESAVEDLLRPIVERGFPVVSTYAKNDGVHVRIVAAARDEKTATNAVETTEAEIRAILGSSIYGDLSASLPKAVLDRLVESGDALSIWEAGTAGQVTGLLLSDESVAHAVVDGHVVPASWTQENHEMAQAALEIARQGMSSLTQASPTSYALGVAVMFDAADELGRYDVRVGIAVHAPYGDFGEEHILAAAPAEAGRRASLLAAEFLRKVTLDSTDRQLE